MGKFNDPTTPAPAYEELFHNHPVNQHPAPSSSSAVSLSPTPNLHILFLVCRSVFQQLTIVHSIFPSTKQTMKPTCMITIPSLSPNKTNPAPNLSSLLRT